MPSTLGQVTIVCPICCREVSFDLMLLPELHVNDDGSAMVGTVELDIDAVYAHLLSHDPNDGGEPMPKAA